MVVQLLLPTFLSFVLTIPVKKLAILVKAIDLPNPRKVHNRPIPRMGGVSIGATFICCLLLIKAAPSWKEEFIISSMFIIALGIIDDIKGVPALVKLILEISISAFFIATTGIQINYITNPFGGYIYLNFLSVPISIIWICIVINAINLIDGLDGLAAGLTSITAFTLGLIFTFMGNYHLTLMAWFLCASTIGFLGFNFYPAKIFMGDTGSLFLGYTLGILSMIGFAKSATATMLLPLSIPLFDVAWTIIRRLKSNTALFAPDKKHIHHQLLTKGFTHRETVLLMYLIQLIISLEALILARLNNPFLALDGLIITTILIGLIYKACTDQKKKN